MAGVELVYTYRAQRQKRQLQTSRDHSSLPEDGDHRSVCAAHYQVLPSGKERAQERSFTIHMIPGSVRLIKESADGKHPYT